MTLFIIIGFIVCNLLSIIFVMSLKLNKLYKIIYNDTWLVIYYNIFIKSFAYYLIGWTLIALIVNFII